MRCRSHVYLPNKGRVAWLVAPPGPLASREGPTRRRAVARCARTGARVGGADTAEMSRRDRIAAIARTWYDGGR